MANARPSGALRPSPMPSSYRNGMTCRDSEPCICPSSQRDESECVPLNEGVRRPLGFNRRHMAGHTLVSGAVGFVMCVLLDCGGAFGNERLLTFTYNQNFDCVDQPLMDLDFNKIAAQSDPNEMQTPICQVVTEPTADPTGGDIKHTAHLYVLVAMFSVDNDKNPNDAMPCPNGGRPGELCGPQLGATLIQLFGFLPEA